MPQRHSRSPQTALDKALLQRQQLGPVVELTGQQRYRVCADQPYLELLADGAEHPPG